MPTLPTYTGGHPGNGHQESLLLQHLGVHLNNKLDWSENTDTLFKKWQSRLSLPRFLGSFGGPFWSVILEKSAGQATSLPGTKRGWRDSVSQNCQLCPGLLPGFQWRKRRITMLSSMLENLSHPLQDTLSGTGPLLR